MSDAIIKVEFLAGTKISDAAYESVAIAGRVGCWVEFNFNGVLIIANSNSAPADIETKYHKELKAKSKARGES